jgi:hypothetical protein
MDNKNCRNVEMLKWMIISVIMLFAPITYGTVEITAGSYTVLMNILSQQSLFDKQEEKTEVITRSLMGSPYNKHTLNHSQFSEEKLVINLKSMDCMTFIEYTEAFKRSKNYEQFITNLAKIRYTDQDIQFTNRRHFFSDWAQSPNPLVLDITTQISPHAVSVNKKLNFKNDTSLLISGLPIKNRTISYIPMEYIDDNLILNLKTGDYVGIYSKYKGLDVSHVGIVIRHNDKVLFRNASSLKGNLKVSDSELRSYLNGKLGIVVFRANYDNGLNSK